MTICLSDKKQKQMDIVLEIVRNAGDGGIRTEQIKIAAMYRGVSCADRYLRWLAEQRLIISEKKLYDKTKTWREVK